MKVHEIMHQDVLSVAAHASLKDVGIFLTRHGISGAPVVDEQGQPIGMVTASDLVAHACGMDQRREADLAYADLWEEPEMPNLDLEFADWATAKDAMTDFLLRVDEQTPAKELIELICETRMHRVLVTSRGHLTGIVTTMDLVRCLGRLLPC